MLFQETFSINTRHVNQVSAYFSGHPIICVHYRAGDYLEHEINNLPLFWSPNIDNLMEKVSQIYRDMNSLDPIIYLASDNLPYATSEFLKNKIPHVTSKNLKFFSTKKNSLLSDFILFTLADILLISNSTFSFSGSMLNQRATTFLRPRQEEKKYVKFDPWNDNVLYEKGS